MLMEVIKDTALDSIKLLPFLYITYLLIELIEHKVGEAGRARIGAAKNRVQSGEHCLESSLSAGFQRRLPACMQVGSLPLVR